MTTYIAFVRAVNVGGTGSLPMTRLNAACEACGFQNARTYLASGNVIFDSNDSEREARSVLAEALSGGLGRPAAVFLRTARELAMIVASNPFPEADGSKAVVVFLDEAPGPHIASTARGLRDEVIVPGQREIYIHYPSGQGRSKLRIPDAVDGTARNLNTIARLRDMTARDVQK